MMKKMNFTLIVLTTLLMALNACSGKKANVTPDPDPGKKPPVDTPVVTTPVTAFKSLNYLYKIAGKSTVAGIHNREPNSSPAVWTEKVYTVTGKYPGLWSGDFLFQQDNINNRQVMINEAIAQYKKGALVNIMWHACNPALAEPCDFDANGVLSKLTDDQWTQLLTDGTHINNQWKSLVDEICVYLQQLKDQKIEVLWRPMHEMNQGKFWWAGRPGPNGTRKLYQMLHDYMTKTKGLNNLIWVWDVQDFGSLHDDVNAYNPGADYWDVAALDVYDGSGYTADKYNTMVTVANGKPIAIGECQTLPTAAQLTAQPKWTFFMGWSELEFSGNSEPAIKSLHTAPNVVTLDKMPGW
jgi:mannan endo-1,4-beta-mannosidase